MFARRPAHALADLGHAHSARAHHGPPCRSDVHQCFIDQIGSLRSADLEVLIEMFEVNITEVYSAMTMRGARRRCG
jgi:hypothetical protein